MSVPNRKLPMSQRMFNSPMEGGPSPVHLVGMLKLLCQKHNREFPHHINKKDQAALATELKHNFSMPDIDWAHQEKVTEYQRNNPHRRDNKDNVHRNKEDNDVSPLDKKPDVDIEDLKKLLDLTDMPDLKKDPNDDNRDFDPEKDDDESLSEKRKRHRDKFKPTDNGEKYVLREDYDNDIEAQVEIFADYDKKIKGNQKAAESAIAAAHKASASVASIQSTFDNRLRLLEVNSPTIVTIKHPIIEPIHIGEAHREFPLLVKAANARLRDGTRLNLWLHGPAGTGKTYAARELARAYFGENYVSTVWNETLQKEFQGKFNQEWKGYDYNGSLATQFQVFGYMDANGKYVSTAFRRIWEYGGVYLFDEIDGSMPDALLALQGALSSEYASFPDGLVKRHDDTIIIAGANTTGMGGGIDYIGAMKQNSAFLNRWAFVEWPHDDALEDVLCKDKKWVRRVRHIRKGLAREQIRSHLVTMRQSLHGEALLAAGIDWPTVERMTLRGSLSEAQWERVSRP